MCFLSLIGKIIFKKRIDRIKNSIFGQWLYFKNQLIGVWVWDDEKEHKYIYLSSKDAIEGSKQNYTHPGIQKTHITLNEHDNTLYRLGFIGGNNDKGSFDSRGRIEHRNIPSKLTLHCLKWRISLPSGAQRLFVRSWAFIASQASHLIGTNINNNINYALLLYIQDKVATQKDIQESSKVFGDKAKKINKVRNITQLHLKLKVKGLLKKAFQIPIYVIQTRAPEFVRQLMDSK